MSELNVINYSYLAVFTTQALSVVSAPSSVMKSKWRHAEKSLCVIPNKRKVERVKNACFLM
jgi:hypothetical protein